MKSKTPDRSIRCANIVVSFYPVPVIIQINITGVLNAQNRPVSNTTNTIGRHIFDNILFTYVIILQKAVDRFGF